MVSADDVAKENGGRTLAQAHHGSSTPGLFSVVSVSGKLGRSTLAAGFNLNEDETAHDTAHGAA